MIILILQISTAFVVGALVFAVVGLLPRVKDLELDIARQKSRISNLEWDKCFLLVERLKGLDGVGKK